MIPKGKLLIIGGAEDKGDGKPPEMKDKNGHFENFAILNELLSSTGAHKIELVTTGSRMPRETEKRYCQAFNKIGYKHVDFIHIADRKEAHGNTYNKRVEKAAAIFFCGGDQFRLSTILGGTSLIDIVRERYQHDAHFIAAGTSAGAMVMSKIMISEGGVSEAMLKKDLQTASGFGLLESCIVDTHFIKRGRFSRLAHAVVVNPGQLGIGLGEDTALIIKKGREATCLGSGMVVIIDGKEMEQTNIMEADDNEPVYVDNMRVHLIVNDCLFDLAERKLITC